MTAREAQKQLTRARLVEAAVTAFHHQGYAGTTVEDIAAAAGVTRATFYLHYEGKLDIYRELERGVRHDIDDLHIRLVDVVRAGRRGDIRAWLDESFDLWHKIKEFATIQEQVASLHTEVRDGMTAHFDDAITAMAHGLAGARTWNHEECRVRAMLAYVQLQNVFRHWRIAGWDVDRALALEVMTDMWVAALVGANGRNTNIQVTRGAT